MKELKTLHRRLKHAFSPRLVRLAVQYQKEFKIKSWPSADDLDWYENNSARGNDYRRYGSTALVIPQPRARSLFLTLINTDCIYCTNFFQK